jgi:hypothetical protein
MMLVGMAVEAAEYSAVFEGVCFYTPETNRML